MWNETLRESINSIFQNRLRSFLTTLGIIFGVMAVIAVVSIMQGVFMVYTSQLEGLGAGFVFVVSGNPSATKKITAKPELTADDARRVAEGSDAVAAVSPFFFDRRAIQYRGETVYDVVVMPTSVRYPEIQNHYVDRGRFFHAVDSKRRARVAVIGPELSEDLGLRDPIGATIRLFGVSFEVIGVMEEKDGINAFGQPFDRAAIVPYSTAVSLGGKRGGGMLLIKLDGTADVEHSIEDIKRNLRASHRISPGESDDFRVVSQSDLLGTVSKITGLATWVILAIVGVALLVGGIGIMNIMLVSVTERTREIGIRLALGATRRDILFQFLTEATLLGIIGGTIGIVFGYVVSWLVTVIVPNFPPPHIPGWSVVLAFTFSASVGIIFGLYPAARAASLDPIDALRYE